MCTEMNNIIIDIDNLFSANLLSACFCIKNYASFRYFSLCWSLSICNLCLIYHYIILYIYCIKDRYEEFHITLYLHRNYRQKINYKRDIFFFRI